MEMDLVVNCLVCNHENKETTHRWGALYSRCSLCESITTESVISHLVITHNDHSDIRNTLPNNVRRIQRLDEALKEKPKRVLDYGCGQGELVELMKSRGIEAYGVDRNSIYDLLQIAKNSLDAITMIEVIEHLYRPKETFELLMELLRPGGIFMIETTFADQISDLKNPYVDPRIGHVCMLSRRGLHMSLPVGLEFVKALNPHVVILRKAV